MNRSALVVLAVIVLIGGGVWYLQSQGPSDVGGGAEVAHARCDLATPVDEAVVGGLGAGSPGGVTVPSLQLADFDGEMVDLVEDFKGTPVVINSWAAWCPFCVDELPAFGAVQRDVGEAVAFVAVDRAESLATAQRFAEESGVINDLTFLLDPDDAFYTAIGGFAMPETLFVKADGTVQFHKRGPMEAAEICERSKLLVQES